MIAFVPMFLSAEYNEWFKGGRVGPRPGMTVDHLADHVETCPKDVAGIDHIGLGSDYDGFDDFPDGMQDVSGFAVLIDRSGGTRLVRGGLGKADGQQRVACARRDQCGLDVEPFLAVSTPRR